MMMMMMMSLWDVKIVSEANIRLIQCTFELVLALCFGKMARFIIYEEAKIKSSLGQTRSNKSFLELAWNSKYSSWYYKSLVPMALCVSCCSTEGFC